MPKPKEKKLPARIRKVLAAMAGQTLCKTMTQPSPLVADHGVAVYHLEPSQKRVATKSAEEAIRLGLVSPNRDALFDDSQTWRLP